jgi:sulfonate transport system substrate-binding protein
VLTAYEKARLWAIQNPDDFFKLFAADAKLDDLVVKKVLQRTDLSDSVIGDQQRQVITAAGDVLKQNNLISSSTDVNVTVDNLIDAEYAPGSSKNVAQK